MYFSNIFSRVPALALAAILLTACGGGGGSGPAQSCLPGTPTLNGLPSPPDTGNALAVTVDSGPPCTGYNVNRLYTDVTICSPGMSSPGGPTRCQTIKHVLVDTGSTGLRLLSSAMAPDLNLSRLTGGGRSPLLNCVQFVDLTYAWGPVATADIVLGGKTATNVPIQVIADPDFISLAAPCSGGGKPITTADTLGANGIIGLGLFKEDCGLRCATSATNGVYYTCTNANCTATTGATAIIAKQVKNPVSLFDSDNNGVLIDLPAVSPPGAVSLSGSLIFGVGTKWNNQPPTSAILKSSSSGDIITSLTLPTTRQTLNLNTSFIDTGSNGLYFDSGGTIRVCVGNTDFYCPDAPTTLSAKLVGVKGEIMFPFSIDNAFALFVRPPINTVLPTLAGPIGDATTFVWGLPFFYGRRVFVVIEDQASPLGTGPFYAF